MSAPTIQILSNLLHHFRSGADGFVDGVTAHDAESGVSFEAKAHVVINATGAFSDQTRHLADPANGQSDALARAVSERAIAVANPLRDFLEEVELVD